MTQVIKISKTNIDALGTAGTVPDNLIFSSDYNTLKYYAVGSTTLSGSAVYPFTTLYYGTINHNLGYVPYFTCYMNDAADTTRFYNNSYIIAGGGGYVRYASVFASTASLIFFLSLSNGASGTVYGTANYFYKLYRNNLGL